MIYTRENLRYCLFAEPGWIRQSYTIPGSAKPPFRWTQLPSIMHSGLTQWGKAFKGNYNVPDAEELDNYDVVHINYTPSNVGKLRYLKKLIDGRNVKIVVNIDHAIDLWGANGFTEINQMYDELQLADHIFCVESTMAESVGKLLGRIVYRIPHPTDTEMLRRNFLINKEEKEKAGDLAVTVFFHAYDKNWLLVSNLLNKMKKEDDRIIALAIGATEGMPAFFRNTFDMIYNRIDFKTTMNLVARSDVVIDTAVTHSYGRVPIEAACLGVPCVTHEFVESGAILFPQLNVDIYNVNDTFEAIYRAADLVESGSQVYKVNPDLVYSYDATAEKFLSMINGGSNEQ